jgi:hypothetical protein
MSKNTHVQPEACTYDDCDKPAIARGLCHGHYKQSARGIPLKSLRPPRGELIFIPGTRVTAETYITLTEYADANQMTIYGAIAQIVETWATKRTR